MGPARDVPESERLSRPSVLLLLGGLVLGLYLRLAGLTDEALMGDELHALERVETSFAASATHFDLLGSHLAFPLLQRLAVVCLGPGMVTYRLPAILAGCLGLLLFFPLGRALVGARAAWLATLFLAVHPMHVFYSRFARAYSLVFLLALVLVWGLYRALPDARRGWRRGPAALAALCAGLLPWVHLSSAGLVAGLALATLGLAWRARGRAADAAVAGGLFAAAGALTLLLHAPARASLGLYFEQVARQDPSETGSLPGMATLLGGSLTAGIVLGLAGLLGAGWLARRAPRAAWLCLAAALGPGVVLLATRPVGMDYAWSRYLMGSLPFLVVLASAGVFAGLRLLVSERVSERTAPFTSATFTTALLLGLLAWHVARGPLFGGGLRRAQFQNTYLALHELPAFDVPFDETPAFYGELARAPGPLTIIEYPVAAGTTKLYRNYALQHPQRTLVGLLEEPGPIRRAGPYVHLSNEADLEASGAAYLVLHGQIGRETRRYLQFVARQWTQIENWGDRHLMEKTLLRTNVSSENVQALRGRLLRRYGEPCFADGQLEVWDLRARARER